MSCAPLSVLAALLLMSACDTPEPRAFDAAPGQVDDAGAGADATPMVDAGPSLRPDCRLQKSASPDRSNATPLAGVPPEPVYVFMECAGDPPDEVVYWLEDPLSHKILGRTGNPPFDLIVTIDGDPAPLFPKNYPSDTWILTAAIEVDSAPDVLFLYVGELEIVGTGEPRWVVSDFDDRRNPRPLEGESLAANAYIHLQPGSRKYGEFEDVRFSIDGVFVQAEAIPPFDLLGGENTGVADVFDPSMFASGGHEVKAEVMTPGGAEVFTANFSIP